MAKVIKLTEKDLSKIINKVLEEQYNWMSTGVSVAPAPKVKPKENINPKNLKKGDGGKLHPNQVADVIALQQKLIDLKLLKTKTGKPSGYFGDLTQKALDTYMSGAPTAAGKATDKNVPSNAGFILIWAYPEYEPKVDGKGKVAQFFGKVINVVSGGGSEGTYGKLGHGGCVVVENNGNCISYEFGRYPGAKQGYGIVLTDQLGKIAKIQNGKLMNARDIAAAARAKSYPPGPSMKMKVAVVPLPNPKAAMGYASTKQREYAALDFLHKGAANCGTFTRDVAEAGGVDVDEFCFPNPTSVVKSFDDNAVEMFDI